MGENRPCRYKKRALIKVVFRVNPIVLLVVRPETAQTRLKIQTEGNWIIIFYDLIQYR